MSKKVRRKYFFRKIKKYRRHYISILKIIHKMVIMKLLINKARDYIYEDTTNIDIVIHNLKIEKETN